MSKQNNFDIIYKSFKNFKKKLPLHEPIIDKKDKSTLNFYLTKRMLSTASQVVIKKFENKLKSYTNSKYVIATNTGTAAIQIALKSIGIKPGDEVLIPGINYIATANSVIHTGGIPHFVDIELETFGIDPKRLDDYLKKISKIKNKQLVNKKSKRNIVAIVPTHVFGNACDIIGIKKIAKKYNLWLIEDASEALGSFFQKKQLGTFGDIGILSFNGNKVITTGGGGAILTNNKKISEKSLHLSKIARIQKKYWEFNYDMPGYNFRMPGINAALGISQLSKINKILRIKKNIHQVYKKYFFKIKNIDLIKPINEKPNFWLNAVIIKNIKKFELEKIILDLEKKKIFTRPLWKSMNKINYLSKFPKMKLINANKLEGKVLSLPSGADILK